jgi:uncharacterized repeat protein (TIGR03803 family)
LILSGNTLYGTAQFGGSSLEGTVFSIATNGADFSTLYTFTNGSDGDMPLGALVLSDDTLYGTTSLAGDESAVNSSGNGTLFSLSVAPVITTHGSLQVTITPTNVVDAGAKWQVDGGADQSSGATVTNLSVGAHTVSFTSVFRWITPASLTITITNGETTKAVGAYTPLPTGDPTVSITSPASGQTVGNALLTIIGTTKDVLPITAVYYELNNQITSFGVATNLNGWTNWSATVTLNQGPNTISFFAIDSGLYMSLTNKITVKFEPSATLTVLASGHGTFTPTNSAPTLAIGSNYTVTATPAKNWLFSNWVTSGSVDLVSTNPSFTVTVQSNLTLTANFVTNLFLAAPGTYNGLFAPTNGPRQQTNSGAITLTLTTNGAWTGKLTIGTNTPSLSGQFTLAGWSTNITKRPGLTTLTTILQLDSASQTIQGAVGDGSFSAAILADLAIFSPTHPAAAYEGLYTLIIPGVPSQAVGPLGSSYGAVTVSSTETITFAGSLADGTAIGPVTSAVSENGYWPLYLPLYGDAGSLWGWSLFTDQSLFATNLSWINATNTVKTAAYRSGFTNQQVSIVASPYNSNAIPLLSLTNAEVILEGVGLTVPITNTITLSRTDVITTNKVPGNTNKLTLTITKSSGLITGSFVDPSNPKQTNTIGGVLLQNQTNAQGYFLGTNQNGPFLLTAP